MQYIQNYIEKKITQYNDIQKLSSIEPTISTVVSTFWEFKETDENTKYNNQKRYIRKKHLISMFKNKCTDWIQFH